MKAKYILSLLIISSFIGVTIYSSTLDPHPGYFFELTFKTNGGGVRPDYGYYVSQHLEDIGIKVHVIVEEWINFIGTLLYTYDFDLALVGLTGGGWSPDSSGVYGETGSLNLFGINTTMPYGQQNEDMLNQGTTIMDLATLQQHYYDWQQLLMDKILPMVPFYSSRSYEATWSNLQGYDYRWGVVDSLPYMEFSGLHTGQVSIDEFIDSDNSWQELNPLLQYDSSSAYISDLMMEPMLQMTPGFEINNTGLITNWTQDVGNDNLFKFTLRDNVYWNPSYNITGRTDSSTPLDPDTTPLMTGLKGEYSNGTDQQVTAKDAVFTLLAWANSITSDSPSNYQWLHDIWIDPVDNLSFWLEVDGDPFTPELDDYAEFWSYLTQNILPEFFLNSTDTTTYYTSGDVPFVGLYTGILDTAQWQTYSSSAFGCGKYMFDYYVEGSVSVLQASPYWMQIGAIDGTTQDLDIGTVIIRVIPDITTALTEFKAGKLDIMGMTNFEDDRKLMQTDPDFTVQSRLDNYIQFMGFNLRNPLIGGADNYVFLSETGFEDYTKALAVRKAIAHAVDRDEINTAIHDGEYGVSHSPYYLAQEYWYYNDIIKYNYNLSTAWEWMERAGYYAADLTDGVTLYDPDGSDMTITSTTTETTTINEDTIITETTNVDVTSTTTTTVPGETKTKKLSYPFGFMFAILSIGVTFYFVKKRTRR